MSRGRGEWPVRAVSSLNSNPRVPAPGWMTPSPTPRHRRPPPPALASSPPFRPALASDAFVANERTFDSFRSKPLVLALL